MNRYLLALSLSLFAAAANAGMLIDNDSLTYFGDIDRSDGLDGKRGRVFDGDDLTSAHRESTTGYAGIALSAPTQIESVQFVSQSNGFDASGSATTITLQAYCKTTTGLPANADDGTSIGSLTFTDAEAVTTKLIASNNSSLQCRYVWGKVTTGVWSALTELRVYGTASFEVTQTATPTVLRRSCNEPAKIPYSAAELPCFRQAFKLNEARAVLIDLHAGFKHTGRASSSTVAYSGVVGLGVLAVRRFEQAQPPLPDAEWQSDQNMVATGNIYDLTQHYLHLPITGCWQLAAGFHEISVKASAATSSFPLNDFAQLGIVEVLAEGEAPHFDGRNLLRIQVLPVGSTCSGG